MFDSLKFSGSFPKSFYQKRHFEDQLKFISETNPLTQIFVRLNFKTRRNIFLGSSHHRVNKLHYLDNQKDEIRSLDMRGAKNVTCLKKIKPLYEEFRLETRGFNFLKSLREKRFSEL